MSTVNVAPDKERMNSDSFHEQPHFSSWKRPRSIAEVALRVVQTRRRDGQTILGAMPLAGNDFRHHVEYRGFEPGMINEQPKSTGCTVTDVWLAGLAEYLSQKYNYPCPAWTEQPQYFLAKPVRLGGANFQRLAQTETPLAWQRRLFFCGASAF